MTVRTEQNRESGGASGQLVLGIETSCDETAVAVVRGARSVLSSVIHSQVALHAPHGGVVPEVAGRSHLDRIVGLVRRALDEANVDLASIEAIAVTNRPGLVGCLLVGVSVAKTLALLQNVPLLGIDHLQAHVDAAFLTKPNLELPLISLVASGGHTSLYHSESRGAARRIGSTLDDAAGEALDKAAHLLGLAYPGGPALETCALGGHRDAVRFKRGLLNKESLDFSFSGMKTALLYHLRGPGLIRPMPKLTEAQRSDLAASFQEAVLETLVVKLVRAVRSVEATTLSIGGGVARNSRLRELIAADGTLGACDIVFPAPALCSDNAAMIAGLGGHALASGQRDTLALEVAARVKPRPGRKPRE